MNDESFKSANNTMSQLNSSLAKNSFAVETDESETTALQQFAYRAKFAEQISKDMRIPKTLGRGREEFW